MANSIPISGLVDFPTISLGDFVALVDSSSLTTYRTSIQELFNFMAVSASCLSASHATTSSYAITASFVTLAQSASRAISSSHANNSDLSVTSSWSNLSGIANVALAASTSISASLSQVSLLSYSSNTASYLIYQGFINGTASYALSSSWADMSTTASYALNIPTTNTPGTLPVGSIVDYAGSSISDTNWMICDGSAISRATYSTLFSAIGILWGAGDTVSTFNIPDLRKRLTIGARTTGSGDVYSVISSSVGNIGGGETYQWHYHLVNHDYVAPSPDDNVQFLHLGYNGSLTTDKIWPLRTTSGGTKRPSKYLSGDNVVASVTVNAVTSNTDIWLGTSFGLNELRSDWFNASSDWTASKTNLGSGTTSKNADKGDLSMPYAITNKIIRVL